MDKCHFCGKLVEEGHYRWCMFHSKINDMEGNRGEPDCMNKRAFLVSSDDGVRK